MLAEASEQYATEGLVPGPSLDRFAALVHSGMQLYFIHATSKPNFAVNNLNGLVFEESENNELRAAWGSLLQLLGEMADADPWWEGPHHRVTGRLLAIYSPPG